MVVDLVLNPVAIGIDLLVLLVLTVLAGLFCKRPHFLSWRYAGPTLRRGLVLKVLRLGSSIVIFTALFKLASALNPKYTPLGLLRPYVPVWAGVIAGVLLVELGNYIAHVLMHRVPFLWRLHSVHHTDPDVGPISYLRAHPLESIVNYTMGSALAVLMGAEPLEFMIFGTIMTFNAPLQHGPFFLPDKFERVLAWVFITPRAHNFHHSKVVGETNSNYATVFSIWDRLFGTLTCKPMPKNFAMGLDGYEAEEWHTIWGLLKTPFVRRPSSPVEPERADSKAA